MKAVAINGSSHLRGNTEILLRKVLLQLSHAGWETDFVQIGGKRISGCIVCRQCFAVKNNRCTVSTDIFNDCLEKVLDADAIILGTPNYFGDVSTNMKAFLERTGYVSLANGGLLRGKIGAAVVAERRGGGTHAFDTINHMFLMSGAIVPGSTYWNLGFGFEKGDVIHDEEGIRNMEDLGRVIAWLGAAIKNHKDSYPKPVIEEKANS